ncbi:sulfatase family protein [Fodinibius sediminis]|uniref:Arylsulfatase A n=1 Tax=Fodinibius sediminis TaxID=1214077 RepID=A0A521DPK9_9BACT|nr:sulfatase-like hydrolase/transferase [Fodinibius sediminis]SMO73667.1 Arylsulfatase A [Fodinibius sediminis]
MRDFGSGSHLKAIGIMVLFLAGGILGGRQAVAHPPEDRPNILLILADDLGYHDVSYYGTPDIRTPHLDRLVSSGMRLDRFYANSPVCSPTRAALMSGQYQDYVGVPGLIRTNPDNSWGYLDPEATLLPEVLSQHGYHTGLVGKWNLGLRSPNKPNERGFDHFHGWLDDMVEDFWEHRREGINYMRLNEGEIDPEGHATDLLTGWAVEYIEEQAGSEAPFFLFLSHLAPHFPVQPPQEWLQKVKAREPDISEKRAKLVAFIEHLDEGIGKVVAALKEHGLYENTMIIFTSDNGGHLPSEANNGPLRDGKQSMYEGGLRVPAGVSWPGHISPDTHSKKVMLTMDVFPTVLEAAGISYDGPLSGTSFLPTLLGEEQPLHEGEPLFFTRREGNMRYGGLTIQAVRLDNWKLIHNSPFGPRELYNLATDPREQHNVIEQHPQKARELNALLMKHIQKGGAVPWQRPAD